MDNKPQLVEMIARPRVQEFIIAHEGDDEQQLLLKYREVDGVPVARIADQIRGHRKAKEKLPSWYATKGLVYPGGPALEQCSSETTAAFKAMLIKRSGRTYYSLCDLTGGFGVDSFHFAKLFKEVDFVEKDEGLLRVVEHNFNVLGVSNISWRASSAETFVQQRGTYDFIYADPSRRDSAKGRVFLLSDCEPNVTTMQDAIWSRADNLMIKASPLLDIQKGLSELRFVKAVHVVAVANECKELIFLAEKKFEGEPEIHCINLTATATFGIANAAAIAPFEFKASDERSARVDYSDPLTYLYEPNAAIMKAGAFKLAASRLGLKKLAVSTHFYTNETIVHSFPGRIFSVMEPVKLDGKLAQKFPGSQANVISRNHPLSVDEIRKRTGLRDGGDLYLVCCSGEREKFALMCKRLK
jgi:hypothetical protein